MASKTQASAALFLSLNLLLFAMVSGCGRSCVPTTNPPSTRTPTIPLPPSTRTPTIPPPPLTPTPSSGGRCPTDSIKLGVCLNLLNGLINLELGAPPKKPCCSLLQGLADLEAAVCLCTVLKANVLGLNLNLPINLSLVLNYCGKGTPVGFVCP